MHHAGLKDVLEELVVVNGPPSFDFDHPTAACGISVRIEALKYFALPPEEDGNNDFFLGRFSFLDSKPELLQTGPELRHDYVAML